MDNLRFEDIAFLTTYFPRIGEVVNNNFEIPSAYKLIQVKEHFFSKNRNNQSYIFWNVFMYLRQKFLCLRMDVCSHGFKFGFDDIKSFNNEFTVNIDQITKDDWDYVVNNILKHLLEIKGYTYSIDSDMISIIIDNS
jgi:hypothetical protein